MIMIQSEEITDKVARNAKISMEHLRNEKKSNEDKNSEIPAQPSESTATDSEQDSDQEMMSRVQQINQKIKNGSTI